MADPTVTTRDPGGSGSAAERHRPGRTRIVPVDLGTEQAVAALRGSHKRIPHRPLIRQEQTS
ncbi:MAG TPA: hypothetical protein VJ831_13135 [Jatrophihabitantaceae bacterium]|nr:hypothetical protein [Jatrophihabitantaceae bacterium]